MSEPMWEWLRTSLRHIVREIRLTRETYTHTHYWRHSSNRPLTSDERAAFDLAFKKFDEGFEAIDRAFNDWR